MKHIAFSSLLIASLAAGCSSGSEEGGKGTDTPVTPSRKTLELSTGITMQYLETGDPSGEALILLHGYTDTSRSWSRSMAHLAALRPDLRIFALDQRGHGGSSLPADPSCRKAPETCFRPADFAGDVLAFMDALGLSRVTLAGHSMGSLVAEELALDHPERFDRIVLVGSTSSAVGNVVLQDYVLAEPVEGSWKMALENKGLTFPDDVYDRTPKDADPDAEAWMAANWVVDPVADPAFIAEIVPETASIPLGTWIGAARALLATDNTARLAELGVPTLVIWATQDGIFPEDPDQKNLRAALDQAADQCRTSYAWKQYGARPLPASGLQEDDIGHNVQWGAPIQVAIDIEHFMATGSPTPDLYAAGEDDPHRIDVTPGAAIIAARSATNCPP